MRLVMLLAAAAVAVQTAVAAEQSPRANPPLKPVVEIEEDVYGYHPAQNGSSPMWCYGSTCLVRIGDDVFASGLETLADAKPLNNVRWTLWKRAADGWQLQQADPKDRTREPCPIAGFADGRLWMSVNPTLVEDRNARVGPARPEILEFSAADPKATFRTLLPDWKEKPAFTEHSYRSFAADAVRGELILFQNIGTSHSQWAFLDRDGKWATGKLVWPERADPKFAPYNSTRARVGYPNVLLRDRAVHFCGASAFNKWERVQDNPELMGRKWSNRWRRLYYTWSPDVTTSQFRPWVEIASTHTTGGWLFPADLWLDAAGRVHLMWMEYPIGRELRDQHFPDIRRVTSLNYAVVVVDGKVIGRQTLVEGGEGLSGITPNSARFHVTPDERLLVFYCVEGTDATGKTVREDRLMEIFPDGQTGESVVVPMKRPLGGYLGFFTATPRGGSPPSDTLDVLGYRIHTPDAPRHGSKYKLHPMTYPNRISYARIRLR